MHEFLATDRCTRCSARAFHVARKPPNLELWLCHHHHNEHHDALLKDYWLIESDVTMLAVDKTAAFTE